MTEERKKQLFNYTLKITDPITRVNLPYVIQNSESLRVKFIRYITQQSNQSLLMLCITSFNNNIYFSGADTKHYCKSIALPPSTLTPVIYESLTSQPDVLVDKINTQNGLDSLFIEVWIKTGNDLAIGSDVSLTNPLFIELEIR